MSRFNADRDTDLRVEIGLNAGPVTGGVIGRSKFIYDLWGDTVSVARALPTGTGSMIRMTKAVYDRVSDHYTLEDGQTQVVSGKKIEFWTLSS